MKRLAGAALTAASVGFLRPAHPSQVARCDTAADNNDEEMGDGRKWGGSIPRQAEKYYSGGTVESGAAFSRGIKAAFGLSPARDDEEYDDDYEELGLVMLPEVDPVEERMREKRHLKRMSIKRGKEMAAKFDDGVVEEDVWREPVDGVPFPLALEYSKKDGRAVEMKLLAGGIRCMLGNSVMCMQQPMTRVYAMAAYVEQPELREAESLRFDKAVLRTSEWKGCRSMRQIVMVPKDGHHWGHGYFKVVLKTIRRSRQLRKDKPRMDKCVMALMELCENFANSPMLRPGEYVDYFWEPGVGLSIYFNEKFKILIENEDLCRALWLTYMDDKEPITPSIAKAARTNWARMGWGKEGRDVLGKGEAMTKQHYKPWLAGNAPTADPCIMRGFQWAEYTFEEYPETAKLGFQQPFGEDRGY